MNTRQKRLCREVLDFYDASGAQPFPLAQLAKKTGYEASDIYDKDSQSGDLWPFDPKARGNYAGMLTFTSGKNPTVSVTPSGLIALEKLCGDSPAAPAPPPKAAEARKLTPPPPEKVAEVVKLSPPPLKVVPPPAVVAPAAVVVPVAPARPVPPPGAVAAPAVSAPAKPILPEPPRDLALAREEFKAWLNTEEARRTLFHRLLGVELIEAALDKFLTDFLDNKK